MPPAPGSTIGAFSSSASVLSDPDSIESFPTQTDNNDNCTDMDIYGSGSIISNVGNDNVLDGNDNGQKNNMNIKQSNGNIQSSNLDPSNETIVSCIQNDINTSNNKSSNSLACSDKASGSGARVAKSTGARAKSRVPGSSSPSRRTSPRVLPQKARGKHSCEASAVAVLSTVSRQVSTSDRRALQRVLSKR